ncbi:Uncharacterised protein [Vibrio cholerae]|nr:Uncharacterised protein [Vibrio cholerae]
MRAAVEVLSHHVLRNRIPTFIVEKQSTNDGLLSF